MEYFWYIIAALFAGIGTGLAGLSAATVMVPCPETTGRGKKESSDALFYVCCHYGCDMGGYLGNLISGQMQSLCGALEMRQLRLLESRLADIR